jgi:hypothetical protein
MWRRRRSDGVRTSANEVKKEKETARENVCCLHFIDENYFFPFFLKFFFFFFPGFLCVFPILGLSWSAGTLERYFRTWPNERGHQKSVSRTGSNKRPRVPSRKDKVECYSNSIRLVAPTRKSAQLKKSDVGTSRRAENVVGRSVSPAEELKVRSRESRWSARHLTSISLLLLLLVCVCVSEREEIDHFKS